MSRLSEVRDIAIGCMLFLLAGLPLVRPGDLPATLLQPQSEPTNARKQLADLSSGLLQVSPVQSVTTGLVIFYMRGMTSDQADRPKQFGEPLLDELSRFTVYLLDGSPYLPLAARRVFFDLAFQNTSTFHPSSSNAVSFSASRSLFNVNFFSQNALLDFGRGRSHFGQRCQKQPWTNIAILRPGK